MPVDTPDVSEIRAQVAAEVEYHKDDGIVPLLPSITNPTLVLTASEDITNPPSNQVRTLLVCCKRTHESCMQIMLCNSMLTLCS